MSNKLFEEAIADARKLREVAEDNAKKAIIEAVTPKIREFIEQQLLEGESSPEGDLGETVDEEETDSQDEVVLDEESLRSLAEMLGANNLIEGGNESGKIIESSLNAAVKGLSQKERRKILTIANKINNSVDILESKNINNKVVKNEEISGMTRNRNFYEVDLRALREAIEEEMDAQHEGEFGDHSMDEGEPDESMMYEVDDDIDAELAGEGSEPDMETEDMINEIMLQLDLGPDVEADDLPEELRGMLADDEGEEDDDDLEMDDDDDEAPEDEGEDMMDMGMDDPEAEAPPADLEEVYDVDPNMLREELRRVRRLVSEGKMDHHFGGRGGKAGVDGAYGGRGKKSAGVKGAFGGGGYGQDPFTNPPQINKLNEALRHQRRTNRALNEKLNKYRSAVQTLREQLEDLNLFNAKLLYVNKLLQNKSLSESQKKSVIKALDEARSLTEAKSLYNSLTETFGKRGGTTLTESRHRGSSSRTLTSSSARNGAVGELDRWQVLAGLKK